MVRALLLVLDESGLYPSECRLREVLQGAGFVVVLRNAAEPQIDTSEFAVVVLGTLVSSAEVGTKYRNAPTPLLYMGADSVLPISFGFMADQPDGTSDHRIRILNSGSPFANRLPARDYALLDSARLQAGTGVENLGPDAEAVAGCGASSPFLGLFTYAAGARLADRSVAVARRTYFGLSSAATSALDDRSGVPFARNVIVQTTDCPSSDRAGAGFTRAE